MKTKFIIAAALLVTFGSYFLHDMLRTETDFADSTVPFSIRPPTPSEEPDAGNVSITYLDQIGRLKAYLAENPEDTTHLLRLARMYHDGHDPVEAAIYYDRLLKLRPDNRRAWLDLANCFAESLQWQKALDATHSMLKNFPGDAEGFYNLGAIHANMGNREKAVDTWNRLLEGNYAAEIRRLAAQSIEKVNAQGP